MTTTINNEHKKLNVPNLRFPEFQGEWEKFKVSDLLDFYSTNSLSWDKLEYGTDAIQNLHYGLIHVGLPTMIDLSNAKLPNITNGNTPKNYELCREGDIAFADASEDTNEVAKAVEFYKPEFGIRNLNNHLLSPLECMDTIHLSSTQVE